MVATRDQAHLVQADAFELNAAIGRACTNCLHRQKTVGAFPGLLAVVGQASVVLSHCAILCSRPEEMGVVGLHLHPLQSRYCSSLAYCIAFAAKKARGMKAGSIASHAELIYCSLSAGL